ncbi:MAG TPA: helix-turn-helix transcriptional regulator [Elusimicrobiales bacterium]|nr:helix-turn-helix transcriptional regulator [Elusimicrobiales bacterium]
MQIEPMVEHKAKKIFKENGIRVAQVAKAMGISYPYCCQILRGTSTCTSENQKKLDELVKSLKGKK